MPASCRVRYCLCLEMAFQAVLSVLVTIKPMLRQAGFTAGPWVRFHRSLQFFQIAVGNDFQRRKADPYFLPVEPLVIDKTVIQASIWTLIGLSRHRLDQKSDNFLLKREAQRKETSMIALPIPCLWQCRDALRGIWRWVLGRRGWAPCRWKLIGFQLFSHYFRKIALFLPRILTAKLQ